MKIFSVLNRCPHEALSWSEGQELQELACVSVRLNEEARRVQDKFFRVEEETPMRILGVADGPRISDRVRGIRPSRIRWYRNPEDFGFPQMTRLLNSVDWAGSILEIEVMLFASSARKKLNVKNPKKERRSREEMGVNFEDLSLLFSKTDRLEKLTFLFNTFIGNVADVKWPKTLTYLDLTGFDAPIVGVEWPRSLKTLFLSSWSGTLTGAVFPPSLELLTVRCFEDKLPLQGVGWDSVKELNLVHFNESMDSRQGLNIEWPPFLERLGLEKFHQDLEHIKWPEFLQLLYFGDWMNQPIANVMFPDSLENLQLGCNFNQPFDGVTWPKSLKQLYLGSYDGPLDVVWPVLLEELSVDISLKHAQKIGWPKSLKKIYLGFSDYCLVKDGKIEL